MRVKELVAFIKERESIRLKKEAGKPRPWTKDPILDRFRFCNVHREDDRVTRELKALAVPISTNDDLWFWWVAARLFNNVNTMAYVGAMNFVAFRPETVRRMLKKRREIHTIFNAAYIVSTNGVSMDKVDYIIDRVLTPLWAARKRLRPADKGWPLCFYHEKLMQFDGLGSFIAAQVVADLKYTEPFKSASDWWTFAASGPGSRRGLARVLWGEVRPISEARWREELNNLRNTHGINNLIIGSSMLHAQDLQNCLCEFDKYERARLGEGTPKQIYKER